MFDRFVRLSQARAALDADRPESALRMLSDPLVAGSRRATDLRTRALAVLLGRCERRRLRGDWTGAQEDCELVLSWDPNSVEAKEARQAIATGRSVAAKQSEAGHAELAKARLAIDAGRLVEAELALECASRLLPEHVDVAVAARLVTARREASERFCAQARQALASGDWAGARTAWHQAVGQDAGIAEVDPLARAVPAAVAEGVAVAMREDLTRGAPHGALSRLARERGISPGILDCAAVRTAVSLATDDLRSRTQTYLDRAELGEALEVLAGVDARLADVPELASIVRMARNLGEALSRRGSGDFAAAKLAFDAAMESIDSATLRRESDAAGLAAREIAAILERAKSLYAAGRVAASRDLLDSGLSRWPLAKNLHNLRRAIEDGVFDRERSLAEIRRLVREGALNAAQARIMALEAVGGGDAVAELRRDVDAKRAIVESGLDQVRRALHGRVSASVEGLAQCISRLDDLLGVQTDHDEMPRLRVCLDSERCALDRIASIMANLQVMTPRSLPVDVAAVIGSRTNLMAADRLDARLLEVVDMTMRSGFRDIAQTRLQPALSCVNALQALAEVLPGAIESHETLRQAAASTCDAVRVATQRGQTALRAHDLDAAETALDDALSRATDLPEVESLRAAVESARTQVRAMAEIEALARDGEHGRAQQRMASLRSAHVGMRTKIFDLKQNLARAQGLDGAFILRVDEGGEYVVFRRDVVSIGNLRDGHADMPVLAAIASQHARFQRRMSFHGGMEDRVLAERGEVRVNGNLVKEHRLRDGDQVQLTAQMALLYRVPSSRSLSASLRVLGGFQVYGTDRVILMKDRGRDGRILIGNTRDAHVAVAAGEREVELFTSNDGRVRVRWEGEGATMDGKPFSGEHPVTPGALVACGGLRFVLLPLPAA